MGEQMDAFRENLNVGAARDAVPEMSAYEEPYYRSGPIVLSMFPRYLLIVFVLAVHVLFGIGYEAPEGEGGLNFVLNLLQLLVSTGIAGFFLVMIILTWINRFVNFSTSGGLYTVSLLIISITPGIFFLEEVLTNSFFSPYIGLEDSGFLPEWSSVYYLIFGGVYAGVMFILTVMYQRAFTYVITDKQVYLKKDFLKVIDSNSHAISLSKIENLKVERSLIGRILGYGSLHVITASGLGLKEESMSIGAGAVSDVAEAATKETSNIVIRLFRFFIFMMKLQRTRKTVDLDPEDCFYGIRRPMDVYALVNELRTRPGAPQDGEIASEENSEDSANNSEI
ncbi:MAG: PH domain-containing protein [Candidatus Thermoplasmatota archaeon]|nr:PH domain-containing protein [Candidatus Thermoplasmatota archaeon]MEC7142866.1 PH domain-containing protein [Candidatus Thermoplasmatota archaeon]MEC7391610.1 PH domain-containing protein [Candidatus Thermoplasmatota archaeon]MEC7462640.1 PH domain-containing protein [Candidatus Thermoplasmatota archaeon]MEC7544430.1 PH domain-containing protein [Candidatus Thermoplasmatota archaeon]|tara:strand:- start:12870 stop:13883 length:1014 start_codon:yes stop_codon:yes gene_type:complete